jgi:membrane protein
VSNNNEYGPIGVVFIILSWLIGLGVVITGGAIVGAWYVGANLSFVRGVRRLLGRRDRQPGADANQGRG